MHPFPSATGYRVLYQTVTYPYSTYCIEEKQRRISKGRRKNILESKNIKLSTENNCEWLSKQ